MTVAVHGDTAVDDRGTDAEPFRVMVWTGGHATAGGYWSHWANYADDAEAQRIARNMATGTRRTYHGATRFRFPLP